jgi:flagellar hook-associated protein 3 FlgL
MMNRELMHHLSRNMERLDDLNRQLSSGKRLLKVSDDVPGARQVMHLQQENGRIDSYLQNMSNVEDMLNMATTTVGHVLDVISAVKERAIQSATGTYSSANRSAIAEDVDGMLQTLLSLANVRHKGAYVFSGEAAGTIPFTTTKNAQGRVASVSYQGARVCTEAPVAPGITTETNVVGSEVFQGNGGLFQTIIELRDAIRTGNMSQIKDSIAELDLNHSEVLRGVGRLGERQTQMGILRTSTEKMRDLNTKMISDRSDADMAELSVEYNRQMALLQVVMRVAASSTRPSIADFL